jgi:hypothetical protein
MPIWPAGLVPLIVAFTPVFSKPVWQHAQVLLVGERPRRIQFGQRGLAGVTCGFEICKAVFKRLATHPTRTFLSRLARSLFMRID